MKMSEAKEFARLMDQNAKLLGLLERANGAMKALACATKLRPDLIDEIDIFLEKLLTGDEWDGTREE